MHRNSFRVQQQPYFEPANPKMSLKSYPHPKSFPQQTNKDLSPTPPNLLSSLSSSLSEAPKRRVSLNTGVLRFAARRLFFFDWCSWHQLTALILPRSFEPSNSRYPDTLVSNMTTTSRLGRIDGRLRWKI